MKALMERVKKKLVKLKNKSHGECDAIAAENAMLTEPDKTEMEQEQQDGNLLMRLPRELRDEIYFYLFSSTRFMYGRRFDLTEEYTTSRQFTRISRYKLEEYRPPPHGLALLRSCRRIHLDIGSDWLQHVIFHFESPSAMLCRLKQVPFKTRSLIRHVRIAGDAFQIPLSSPKETWDIHACFDLLLRMNLDTLTVFGPAIPYWTYEDLKLFVKYGRGWKELHYITYTSAFVWKRESSNGDKEMVLPWDPQPAAWQRDLENRDGPNSGASVTMYKSTDPSNPLSVMCPTLRTEFHSYPPTPTPGVDHSDGFSRVLDLKEDTTGILIVVKRGKNSNWQGMQEDLPWVWSERTSLVFPWVRTKNNRMWHGQENVEILGRTYRIDSVEYCPKDGQEHNDAFRRGPKKTLVDNYRHVDDYAFPPHGFRTEHPTLVPWTYPEHLSMPPDNRGRDYWLL